MLDAQTASAEDALVDADIALYDAKQQGRNRVAVFRPDTRRDVLAGLSWSQTLKRALAGDLFVLHAQPIVDLRSGVPRMHELLIRMRTEDGQLAPPSRFLPAAKRFGFMPAIDRGDRARSRAGGKQPGSAPGGEPRRKHDLGTGTGALRDPDADRRRR